MRRYFFDLVDHEVARDDEGIDLPNDTAARIEAIIFAGQYLRDHPDLVWDGHEIRVQVYKEGREPLYVVVVLGIDLERPS